MMTLEMVAPASRMNTASASPVSVCPWQSPSDNKTDSEGALRAGYKYSPEPARSKRFIPPSNEPEMTEAVARAL